MMTSDMIIHDTQAEQSGKRRGLLVKRLTLGTLLVSALILTGCGRKNDLELPPSAQVDNQEKTLPAGKAPKEAPKKDFVLDLLL